MIVQNPFTVSESLNDSLVGMNGIVWVSLSPENAMNNVHKGVLIAFEADNLKLLWSDPDDKISFAKFVPPTIAGGKAFQATFGDGYSDPSCAPNGDQGGNTGCGSIVIYGHKSLRVIRPH